jgi:outer membrane protein assembly factor BamB
MEQAMPRILLTIVVLLSVRDAGADVPQFRGPGGAGVSEERNLPLQWSDQENLRWKANLPGRGLSNPVIADGRVFVTACTGFEQKRLHVLCFDVKSGKQLWERQFWATGTTQCHPKTNMAAPTPVTDGQRVYALFATGDLVCLDRTGDLVWYRSLVSDYPTVGNNVGMAASPVLADGTLIVCLENVGESFVAGLDIATGQNKWRLERPRGINWVTPLVLQNNSKSEVLVQGSQDLTAHDPATGKRIWTLKKGFSTIPSPVAGGGMVFAPGGKLIALRPGTEKSAAEVVWENGKLSTGFGSPLYYQGLVYTVSANGIMNCADATTGKILWTERLEGAYSASPLAANGKIYVANEAGLTSVLQAGKEAKVLAANQLADTILASPVAADGAIFLRSDKHLYCISGK